MEKKHGPAGALWTNRRVYAGEEIELEVGGHVLATKVVDADGWWICTGFHLNEDGSWSYIFVINPDDKE